jgi:1,4-alpha-glucan branching enzyme
MAFGRAPAGIWLPECGYYPGLDQILREAGIRYFVLETHGLLQAEPRPRHGVYAPVYTPSGVAAFGRDPESSKAVWSSVEGYPGDSDYREFYRDIGYDLDYEAIKSYLPAGGIRANTGIKYYRITGKTEHKDPYIRSRALQKAAVHVGNFLFNRGKQVERLAAGMDRPPLVVAPYDAELFGHWWFEGPDWLDLLVRKAADGQTPIRLITPSEYLDRFPVNQVCVPTASTWGYKGYNEVWLNGSNDWIYPHLHQAANLMADLAGQAPRAQGLKRRALNQAARELLLAQASDWAFLLKTGAHAEYAVKRTRTHLTRLQDLARQIRNGKIEEGSLGRLEAGDCLFPALDYRMYASQLSRAPEASASLRRDAGNSNRRRPDSTNRRKEQKGTS